MILCVFIGETNCSVFFKGNVNLLPYYCELYKNGCLLNLGKFWLLESSELVSADRSCQQKCQQWTARSTAEGK